MFRITILLYDLEDRYLLPNAEIPLQLQEMGFTANFATKSLQDLGLNPDRVAQFVDDHPSDAWVVCSASHEILKWFADQPFPIIAMYGGFAGLPIASVCPRQSNAMNQCIQRLGELGHQHIVMFAREERRKPLLGRYEQNFLNALEAHGLASGKDNLPDWDESLTGLRNCLDSLFSKTPPTALIFQESQYVMAAQKSLTQQGIITPKQVSLFCSEYNPCFDWGEPMIAHSRWDNRKVIERIACWAQRAKNGEPDTSETLIDTKFIEGGSIGPAPGRTAGHSDKL